MQVKESKQEGSLPNLGVRSGTYQAHWDGKDEKGQTVASGIYFYVLKSADRFTDTKKMVLIK